MLNLSAIFTLQNLLLNLMGVVVGIIFGFLPGLSATMGVALTMPFTFGLDSTSAFAVLLGVYVGGIYGGSITAILIRTPGTPASAATVLDGYPMTEKGQARLALSTATLSSFIGGLFSCFILFFGARTLANFALKFGPAEYFSVALFGLSMVASLSRKNIFKGVISACLGLMLSTVGIDKISGMNRFTMNNVNMMGGIELVSALIGLFAITEVFSKLESIRTAEPYAKIGELGGKGISFISLIKEHAGNLLRSSFIGTIVGIIPATGSGTAAWISYDQAIRASKHPETFGHGEVDGVVASEAANNAVTGGALIPLLALGVPGDSVTAIMMGALMIKGLTPGPTLFANYPEVINGIYIMLIIANIFMLILGLSGVRLFLQVLKVPTSTLMTCVLTLCCIGAYAIRNNVFDVGVALFMGIFGYLFIKADYPVTPALLGLILGSMIETNFRRAMTLSNGNLSTFVSRPISCVFLLISVFAFVYPIAKTHWEKRTGRKQPSANE